MTRCIKSSKNGKTKGGDNAFAFSMCIFNFDLKANERISYLRDAERFNKTYESTAKCILKFKMKFNAILSMRSLLRIVLWVSLLSNSSNGKFSYISFQIY